MDRRGCLKRARQSGQPARTVAATCLATVAVLGLGLMTRDASAQVQTYFCPSGFEVGVAPAPPIPLTSLKTIPNPVLPNGPNGAPRDDLAVYIANQTAAIRLGKALFWDMQAGSDNKTACATCHAQAGADVRNKNQLNPGANGVFDSFVPNDVLFAGDFPFSTPATDDTDNIAGKEYVIRD
ncbi:MAG TPA: cytochrome c peroxidase, partial [Verrucomicrobiae bacterium]|nr:cytochrome c peroxidase [Verrucomicrobiae bacterium]